HAPQFLDGDVIALALLHAGVGEIAEREQNDDESAAEFNDLARLRRHRHYLLQTLLAAEKPVKQWIGNGPSGVKLPRPSPEHQCIILPISATIQVRALTWVCRQK